VNKNTLIGTLLICAITFAWMWTQQPSPEQREAYRRQQDSLRLAADQAKVEAMAAELVAAQLDSLNAQPADSAQAALLDSINFAKARDTYGNLAACANGQAQTVVLENSVIRLTLSTKGGQIQQAVLKKYDDYKGDTLEVFGAGNNEIYYTLNTPKGNFQTDRFYFQPIDVTPTSCTMRLESTDGGQFDFVYNLPDSDSYLVEYSIRTAHIDRIINDRTVLLNWYQQLPRTELGRSFEERYSQIYYKYKGNSTDNLSSSSAHDDETLDAPLCWLSFQNQFFSTMLISNDLFTAGRIVSESVKEEENADIIKKYSAQNLEFEVNTSAAQQTIPLCFYIGPKDHYKLADMSDQAAAFIGKTNEDLDLEDSFYLGWRFIVHYVNAWIFIPLFHFLDNFISNYGIIILIITIFMKLITLPLTYKTYKSTAKMRVAQQLPEIQAINEKYRQKYGDELDSQQSMEKMQETQGVYSRAGVSQMGGCLPMLVQWPVLIALFYFFPTSLELRHQPFLWADDLSTYDAILSWNAKVPIFGDHLSLFCLLMTATNLFYTWLMQKQNPQQQAMPGMKWMMYLMPLMFLFFLNDYSAGLSYYYFLSTLFGIVITYAIRWSLDEKAILEQMKQNLKNPKKGKSGKAGSGWVERLQKMQKEQEAQLRKQREEREKKLRR